MRYLHDRGFPFATHGRTEMGIAHPFFDFDNGRYAEIAVERLAARGRRRLALLPPPAGSDIRRAYHRRLPARGRPPRPDRRSGARVTMRQAGYDAISPRSVG